MADHLSKEKRSWNMARIRSSNTRAEFAVRKLLHSLGYRFRLHRSDLPGKPDIVLPRHRTVIFVHGCFWHRHNRCSKSTTPKTNIQYWTDKFKRNIKRDIVSKKELNKLGWRVIVIWECETTDDNCIARKIKRLNS